MIASAEQYAFVTSSIDNRREHVGWGFPSLRNLYDNQNRMLLVPEDDVVTQGTTRTYNVTVQTGEPELKVCMTFLDPAGNMPPQYALAGSTDAMLERLAAMRAIGIEHVLLDPVARGGPAARLDAIRAFMEDVAPAAVG